jgi:hypothetical protein
MPEDAAAGQATPQQPQPEPSADTGPTALARWRWPGILLAAGVGLLALAYFAVYPRPETAIAVPASPSLVVYTSGHVSQVTYLVTARDPARQPEMQVTVSGGSKLVGNQLVPLPIPQPGSSSLEVTLPPGLAFRDCAGSCVHYAGEVAWVKPLDFVSGKATDVFPVRTAGFGVDVSSAYAYAAIPQVSFMGLASQQSLAGGVKVLPPALRAEYRIPTAGRYDWSSGPVPAIIGSEAIWQEILTAADTPGQTAAGVNHSRQVHDADFTFLAGFLLGLAGSVALAGAQLLLPSSGDSRSGS